MAIEFSLESIGHIFYLVSPNRTTFEKLHEVPLYLEEGAPQLFIMFVVEIFVSWYIRGSKIQLNDTLSNLSQNILMQIAMLLLPGGQMAVYMYIYNHYRLVSLPWNSLWTWWLALFAYDFMYYIVHRLAHVINIFWATHHTHHSSEYYNMGTNYRQNVMQIVCIWILFLPVAFFIPGSLFFAHAQINNLYQYWIHTGLVKSLGPLEYVLNTPSHHRVHHGRNRKYIDKNFGGFLIIWDRIFGTFEAEKEEVVYGVTKPVNSFNLITLQFLPYINMWKKLCMYEGVMNKFSVLFKGPGWEPGKPWCGERDEIPNVKAPMQKYNIQLPLWAKIYVLCHFLVLVSGHFNLVGRKYRSSSSVLYLVAFYEIFSLVSIGFLLDKKSYSPKFEFVRCVLHFVLDYYLSRYTSVSLTSLQARWIPETYFFLFHFISVSIWITYCMLDISMKEKKANFFISQIEVMHSTKILDSYNNVIHS